MTREQVIAMLMEFAQYDPLILAKYADDDDGGEEAFAYLVDNHIRNNEL